ncbi:hypothetical protein [Pleionea sp. CnH1-48]|uniref:hypothetical protein n=1 Tax=Pleionea sp. CnH1-48 TaxID=2954494 RepID=UPI002097D60B|nr:hypothetical protein [Pleionea sp. CnH1-48]MCO7223050.1 hypothetical protein [Pleionea sp. CnH1-48]
MNDEILRIIDRDFEEKDRQLVIKYLKKIHLNNVWGGNGTLHQVQHSILLLAEGSVYRVKDLVKCARDDFRDVIAAATQIRKKPKLP